MRKIALTAIALFAVVTATAAHNASALTLSTTANTKSTLKTLGVTLAEANEIKQTDVSTSSQDKTADTSAPTTPAPVMVTVAAGDSLSSIAAAHATTWVRIFDANTQVANPDLINPGDQLRIPSADEQLTDRPLPQAAPVQTTPVQTPQVATASYTPVRAAAPQASYSLSGNTAKDFIYAHESGNNPNATNPSGCYGLGQDCNGRVRTMCGADYACQDAYFTSYAISRYGSWDAAAAYWQTHGWW